MSKAHSRYISKILLNGALASFCLYFCMYGLRKPFSVATFESYSIMGVDYKIVLILFQVFGYMLSKFIGISVVSSLKSSLRVKYLISMILFAELTLILFGLLPISYNFIFFFFNGLSLGMIWGVVFSYLEGRKTTEILSIILCSSFIVSSGAVKSVGLFIMNSFGTSEFWMPAVTGAFFILPFLISLYFLKKLPPPDEEDILLRKERHPMLASDRKKVLHQFLFPIIILVMLYTALTVLRDFRDNFSREIWDSIGFENDIGIYTWSELPIAIMVLILLGLFGLIKNNYKAFIGFHFVLILSCIIICLATFLFQRGMLSPMFWMIAVGFGLYACYVPFNSIFFDRMIATFRINGNAGYLIYIADAFGYLGSMFVLLYKNFGQPSSSWLQFFILSLYVIAALGFGISIISLIYFKNKYYKTKESIQLNSVSTNE